MKPALLSTEYVFLSENKLYTAFWKSQSCVFCL